VRRMAREHASTLDMPWQTVTGYEFNLYHPCILATLSLDFFNWFTSIFVKFDCFATRVVFSKLKWFRGRTHTRTYGLLYSCIDLILESSPLNVDQDSEINEIALFNICKVGSRQYNLSSSSSYAL
jgi:hypothetical protein